MIRKSPVAATIAACLAAIASPDSLPTPNSRNGSRQSHRPQSRPHVRRQKQFAHNSRPRRHHRQQNHRRRLRRIRSRRRASHRSRRRHAPPRFHRRAHASHDDAFRRLEGPRTRHAAKNNPRANARCHRQRARHADGRLHHRARCRLGSLHGRRSPQRDSPRRSSWPAHVGLRSCHRLDRRPLRRHRRFPRRPVSQRPARSMASSTAPIRRAKRSASTTNTAPTSSRRAPAAAFFLRPTTWILRSSHRKNSTPSSMKRTRCASKSPPTATAPKPARRAILAGVDSIEHGTFLNDEDLTLMKQQRHVSRPHADGAARTRRANQKGTCICRR